MPPPERFPHDDPREWINRARSNFARARSRIPEAYLEDLCFDAQQAAEKAIKAVMMMHGVESHVSTTWGDCCQCWNPKEAECLKQSAGRLHSCLLSTPDIPDSTNRSRTTSMPKP